MNETPHAPRRLAGYLGSLSAFTALVAGSGWLVERRGRGWPARYAPSDLVLGALAVHKVSRIITKEQVTTPLRAPFTEFKGNAGSAEVEEEPRHGWAHAPGELLTCPFCLAPWLATGYVAGLAISPGRTRALATVFATVAGSDLLQHLYAKAQVD